jgi:cytochrome c
MKKIIPALLISSILFTGCGGSSSGDKKDETKTEEKKEAATDLSSNPDYQKGLALLSKSDCLTCHKVDEKVTGPSYRDVANKYAGTSDTIVTHLANKVRSGGTGVWGEVAMLPHPAVSQEDAEAMVKYILLLKK